MNAFRTLGLLVASLALIGVAEAQKGGGGKTKFAVDVIVNGQGTVTSNTGGISCPGTCSTSVNRGTTISLTATPNTGSNFLGWDGDCAIYGTDPVCTLTVSAALSAIANFDNGNNPPTPYSPVIVDVTCDGTGTKLQGALNALNPVANVYDVRVSGVCPEDIQFNRFNGVYLFSSNPAIPAKIGTISVSGGSYVRIVGIELIGSVSRSQALTVSTGSNVYAENLVVSCETGNTCETAVFATDSEVRIVGIKGTDTYPKLTVKFWRGTHGYFIQKALQPELNCTTIAEVESRLGSAIGVAADTGCIVEKVSVGRGGVIDFVGALPVGFVDALEGGSVFGAADVDPWFDTFRCNDFGISVVANSYGGFANQCL